MFKRIIAIVLACMLVISCIPATLAASETTIQDPSDGLISAHVSLTRGVFFYALWRFYGCPEPAIENPFTDLYKADFYYKAALWSVEKSITTATSKTEYGPNAIVNRAQVVTFLWRAAGCPEPDTSFNPFVDVTESDFFYKPALWACSEGFMSAMKESVKFAPLDTCYYGQIYWDGSAPAVDNQDWYGIFEIEARPVGKNIDLSFDEDTGTLTLSGTGNMYEYSDGYLYNTIAPWCSYQDQVKSVVIEDGITSVGSYLFIDFNNLEYVSIPDCISWVCAYAFYGCSKLQSISLPSGLTSIGNSAFSGFTNLEGIVIPESVTKIGRCAFYKCKSITEANIPAGITVIKDCTFYGCEKLSRIYIPATVTTIEMEAFDKCSSLTDVYYGGTAEQWAQIDVDYTSWGGTNLALKTATIHYLAEEPKFGTCGENATWTLYSNGILSIDGTGPMYDYAQSGSTAIQPTASTVAAPWSEMRNRINTVVIQEGITHIGSNSFCGCTNLNAAILPDSLSSVGDSAFADCANLTNIYFSGSQEEWDEFFGDAVPSDSNLYVDMPNNPFSDVKPADYYCGPVLWAVENAITNGTTPTTFAPGTACNRAQVVTFLWRAAGSPEPAVTENPFVDVEKGSFFEKAVLWAVEEGITIGTDASHFSPGLTCNRATVVTFLHRAFGEPAVESSGNPFQDVPNDGWYTAPILWAVEQNITNGVSADSFAPDQNCSRAQIVTFLFRAYVN